jgi:DNA modification methylase
MKRIGDKTVDMVLTDPPYGTTACKWDTVIPFEPMWKELKRVCRGPILLFGSEPFSSALRMSNIKMFKYDWIWQKNRHSNFFNCKIQPRNMYEIVSCFWNKTPNYNPQLIPFKEDTLRQSKWSSKKYLSDPDSAKGLHEIIVKRPTRSGALPIDIIQFKKENNNQFKKNVFHPTQKPVPLLEYLIKTYTLEGETVLDFTMGSGSTGVACKNLNRKFIGIEKDKTYFEIAKARINGARPSVQLDMINV